MKPIMGILAYAAAVAVVFLSMFIDVDWPITAGASILLVLGALFAWQNEPGPKRVVCDCERCDYGGPATADDVR